MVKKLLRSFILLISRQYTSIGGQAVIEGVMMRSPNAFIIAVRKPDGSIRLRRDQWFGWAKRFSFLKKPFLRGVLTLFEAMANGIVSLNYSANIAMEEELRKKAEKKGEDWESYSKKMKDKEKVNWGTFLTVAFSLSLGILLFVVTPHALTAFLGNFLGKDWSLDGFSFHFVDGVIKACMFIAYIYLIGFLPDIRRVFQYHGAEHKSISTFEAGEELVVENARKYSTLHPRCGTSFIFFLLFISIVLFSAIFAIVPVGQGYPLVLKHMAAVLFKILLMIPIAGISYEIIRFAGKKRNLFCRFISAPGMMLQRLTTREPDDEQLEVALASLKSVLHLEDKYNLDEAEKKLVTLDEVDILHLAQIEQANKSLHDFLE